MRITLDSQSTGGQVVAGDIFKHTGKLLAAKQSSVVNRKEKGPSPLTERTLDCARQKLLSRRLEIYNEKFRFICFIPLISSRRITTFLSDSAKELCQQKESQRWIICIFSDEIDAISCQRLFPGCAMEELLDLTKHTPMKNDYWMVKHLRSLLSVGWNVFTKFDITVNTEICM